MLNEIFMDVIIKLGIEKVKKIPFEFAFVI